MKLREQKRILYFLTELEEFLEFGKKKPVSQELIKLYTDNELREIVHFLYQDTWSENTLRFKKRNELIELINPENNLLLWAIDSLEKAMTNTLSYSQKTVSKFFERIQNEIHYLASKPIKQWDEYDTSNYTNLLMKTGTTKKVYAIFNNDVLEEDVYTVPNKPSYFFDTQEEAKEELERCYEQGRNKWDSLKIIPLYIIT